MLVNGDIFVEDDKAFTVHLSNPVNATIRMRTEPASLSTTTIRQASHMLTTMDSTLNGNRSYGAGPAIAIGYDAFDTIQEGTDAVTASGTVNVYAGSYKENPNANKAVTLKGANNGVAGVAVRGPESSVVTNGNQTAVFTITANNVSIDGFSIDGDDPSVTGTPIFSGDDINATYGVRPTSALSNVNVTNNIVKKVAIAFRGDEYSQNNTISGNWFDSIGNFDFGYAVWLRSNYYADVTSNKMTRVWSGVSE